MAIRVLKIIHTMGHGGAENIFRWLAWQLKNEGVEVVGAIPLQGDRPEAENWVGPALEELGIDYLKYDKRGSPADLLKSMKSVIRAARPDIVHSHLLDSNFYSSIACRMLSVPHICTEHGDVLFNRSSASRLKYSLLSWSSQSIVCVSNRVKESLAKRVRLPSKILVIPNGIPFSADDTSTFRNEAGIPGNAIVVGNVGNLYPVKGQRFLIQAFLHFIREYPDSYLVLVGRGAERANLESLARQMEIPPGRIIMTGFRKDVGNILGSMDIYVQPSLSEGMPISLLEAMACGIPVVATDVGGVREVLDGGKYGTLVAAGSWNGIFESLRILMGNHDAYRRMALEAREHTRNHFSLQAMALRYIQAYHQVLSR